jgi:hypothetical protein
LSTNERSQSRDNFKKRVMEKELEHEQMEIEKKEMKLREEAEEIRSLR